MTGQEIPVTDASAAADALATPPTELRPAPPAVGSDGAAPPPRLADDIELIGEFADSGFKRPPFIARRGDGQMVQMPEMLYRLAEQIDGRAGYDELAQRFSGAIRRGVTEANARMLVEERLRPLGVVAPANGDAAELRKVDPLLALTFRATVVPDGAVRRLTTVFRRLFAPVVMVLAVLALVAVDGWLFWMHGISQSVRDTLDRPALMLMLIAGVIVATAFHEIGHATACRYGGARPGVMGAGIYLVWPAFYTDITDAYRLSKWGRLRADIGGMYFNAIFALAVVAAYAATRFEPLLLLVVLQNAAILEQALPVLRLDGYYILSDLTGVPDIFLRIRPILASLVPGRPADRRVTELKPWVRTAVSVYVLAILAFLTVTALALVINVPRILATGYTSADAHLTAAGPAFGHAAVAQGVLDVIQGLFLILPAIGLAYSVGRVVHRSGILALRWSAGHPARRAALGAAATAGVAVAALSWWPNGQYRPIQRGERGTIGGLWGQVSHLPTGRPSLTPQRARQLGLGPGGAGRSGRAGATGRGAGPASGLSGAGMPTPGARLHVHNARGPLRSSSVAGAGAAGSSGAGAVTASAGQTTPASTTSTSAATPAPDGGSTTASAPAQTSTTTSAAPAGSGATDAPAPDSASSATTTASAPTTDTATDTATSTTSTTSAP